MRFGSRKLNDSWSARRLGQASLFVFMPYGGRWKRYRRAFWQHFYSSATPAYEPIQLSATHTFLQNVLHDPSRAEQHIRL